MHALKRQIYCVDLELENFHFLEKVTLVKSNFRNLKELSTYLTEPSWKSLKLTANVASIDDALEQDSTKAETLKRLKLIPMEETKCLGLLLFLLSKFFKLDTLSINEMDLSRHFRELFDAIKHIPNLDFDFDAKFIEPENANECTSITSQEFEMHRLFYQALNEFLFSFISRNRRSFRIDRNFTFKGSRSRADLTWSRKLLNLSS